MIIFKRLTFQNFLSVGNQPVSIDLNSTKTTLVHGSNGSGKSTILDALCYSLFNKPFRKVNLPQLINTQNKKGLLTEVEFSIGKNDFIVQRGNKPKVFRIFKNGEEIESKAADRDNQAFLEQSVLKLSYKSFTQIVILGSSNFVPFMQLPSAGRRECVEDFLDIKVFSTMAVIAKERLKGLKDKSQELRGDIGNLEYKIDLQEDRIKELEEHAESNIRELEETIQNSQKEIENKNKSIESAQENERAVFSLTEEVLKGAPKKKLNEFTSIVAKLENKVERLNKNIIFYNSNDTCHTCHQTIPDDIKEKYVNESQSEMKKYSDAILQAQEKMDELNGRLEIASNRQKHIQSLQNSIFQYQTEVSHLQKEVQSAEEKILKLNSETGSIDRERGKLDVLNEDLQSLKKKYNSLLQSVKEHDIVCSLLRDSGIKTHIVKKYLPSMNKFIRQYLSELELPIHFTLDEEFNESVASPLHQNFSYASFSEGQKARIDLSLMFTWREIGKLKNSVTTNLLILDEVFSSSLDDVGKENLMRILRYNLPDNQRVVVVDHTLSAAFKDKFDRSIEVNKVKGFSQYD